MATTRDPRVVYRWPVNPHVCSGRGTAHGSPASTAPSAYVPKSNAGASLRAQLTSRGQQLHPATQPTGQACRQLSSVSPGTSSRHTAAGVCLGLELTVSSICVLTAGCEAAPEMAHRDPHYLAPRLVQPIPQGWVGPHDSLPANRTGRSDGRSPLRLGHNDWRSQLPGRRAGEHEGAWGEAPVTRDGGPLATSRSLGVSSLPQRACGSWGPSSVTPRSDSPPRRER